MTPTELRAIDLQMTEFMGWKRVEEFKHVKKGTFSFIYDVIRYGYRREIFEPTVSPADAMMVLRKAGKGRTVSITQCKDGSIYLSMLGAYEIWTDATPAPTLELAICLFAKEVASDD